MQHRFTLLAGGVAALAMLAGGSSGAAQQPPGSAPTSSPADPKQHVVVSVNDVKITEADLEIILRSLPPQSRQYYSGEGRHLLPQYLVRMKVLSEEARKQQLGQQAEVRDAIAVATESILADAARRRIEQNIAAPDELVEQLYQGRKKQFEEVRLRRILIRTESSLLSQSSAASKPPMSSADARKKLEELRQQIAGGAEFAEVAKAHSDDLESAPAGGDIGFVNYQTVIPPVAQAADRLSPDQISEIIPTPYGLELYQVVEKRTKPLTEVRPQLEAIIRQGKLEEKLQEIQSQYKIIVDQDYFAPQGAAAPAPFGAPTGTPSAP
ncbi:MAG: peptidylprolyl isomerase [Acidobacteria bacterium]|nr:peptidylprolyl isomerase [Acidobacteriota bacterium]